MGRDGKNAAEIDINQLRLRGEEDEDSTWVLNLKMTFFEVFIGVDIGK